MTDTNLSKKWILVNIDYTECFASPDGALTVKEWHLIWVIIKDLIDAFKAKNLPHVFTGDAHPENHISFASRFWIPQFEYIDGDRKRPDHSIEWTPWASLYQPFDTWEYKRTIKKWHHIDQDSYSAFGGVTEDENKTFDEYLQDQEITDIYLTWLATDYCVWHTALDARKYEHATNLDKVKNPYNVYLITDAVRGVAPETTAEMMQHMKNAGVIFTTTKEVIATLLAKY